MFVMHATVIIAPFFDSLDLLYAFPYKRTYIQIHSSRDEDITSYTIWGVKKRNPPTCTSSRACRVLISQETSCLWFHSLPVILSSPPDRTCFDHFIRRCPCPHGKDNQGVEWKTVGSIYVLGRRENETHTHKRANTWFFFSRIDCNHKDLSLRVCLVFSSWLNASLTACFPDASVYLWRIFLFLFSFRMMWSSHLWTWQWERSPITTQTIMAFSHERGKRQGKWELRNKKIEVTTKSNYCLKGHMARKCQKASLSSPHRRIVPIFAIYSIVLIVLFDLQRTAWGKHEKDNAIMGRVISGARNVTCWIEYQRKWAILQNSLSLESEFIFCWSNLMKMALVDYSQMVDWDTWRARPMV